jgi:hypothetical protein
LIVALANKPFTRDGWATFHTAGAWGNGERVWVLAKLSGQLMVGPDDVIDKYLPLSNKHDGPEVMASTLNEPRSWWPRCEAGTADAMISRTSLQLRGFLNSNSTRQHSFSRGSALGWGMPAAVGYSLGNDRAPAVSTVGDCAGQPGAILATCIR